MVTNVHVGRLVSMIFLHIPVGADTGRPLTIPFKNSLLFTSFNIFAAVSNQESPKHGRKRIENHHYQ